MERYLSSPSVQKPLLGQTCCMFGCLQAFRRFHSKSNAVQMTSFSSIAAHSALGCRGKISSSTSNFLTRGFLHRGDRASRRNRRGASSDHVSGRRSHRLRAHPGQALPPARTGLAMPHRRVEGRTGGQRSCGTEGRLLAGRLCLGLPLAATQLRTRMRKGDPSRALLPSPRPGMHRGWALS